MPDAPRYQTHGALVPGDPLYVRRRADHDLEEGVLAGDFCYVLAPRQVGKSSLRARVLVDLRSAGIMTATANIQAGGGVKSESVWYEGIIDQLVTSACDLNPGFTFPFDWGKWWDAERGPFAQRFVKLLKEGFLADTDCQWVITIDEIDASISLPFTDSFFAAIRLCFDQRPEQPAFRRLSIVLLGAATPTELIKDRSRTPFNIGRRIEMTDFSLAEAEPLAAPLPIAEPLKSAVLTHVLHWTGGQPHLTQTVCEKLRTIWKEGTAPADADAATGEVDRCVESTFLHGGILGEAHFAYITKRARDFPRARHLLRAYRQARSPGGLRDDQRSTVAAELKIAGLVKPDANGTLRVANPIYERVFNEKWIRDTTPVNWPVILGEIGMAAAMLTFALFYFVFLPQTYSEQIRGAFLDFPREAYRKLAAIPGYKNKADESLAQFWDGRAASAESESSVMILGVTASGLMEGADIALIYRLRALETVPTELRRHQAERIIREKLAPLRATFREWLPVWAVALSPDGSTAITGSVANTAQLWDVGTGRPKPWLIKHESGVHAVAFHPREDTVLTGSFDKTAQLWDARTGQEKNIVLPHPGSVWAASFSSDGTTILTGCDDGAARLWDTGTGQPRDIVFWQKGTILSAAFSPDGSRVLTGCTDSTAQLWDTRSGMAVGAPLVHHDNIRAVAFNRDGSVILTASIDHTVQLWDSQSGQPKGESLQHPSGIRTAAFSPAADIALTGCDDHLARLWDVRSGQMKGLPLPHHRAVMAVAFSRDGNLVLTADDDGTTRLWDFATIEDRGERVVEEALAGTPAAMLERWLERTALRFDKDGARLIPRYPLPEPSKENPEPRIP